MDSLPTEMRCEILQHLGKSSLKAVRLVNKHFDGIAAPLLFDVLVFSGEASDGRTRTVEYAGLPTAVEDVLPITRHVKTFVFRPALYKQEGM